MKHILTTVALLLALTGIARAQTPPLQPGQVIAFEFEPGQMLSSTGVLVPRPDANIVFDYRLNSNSTPTLATKAAPCTAVTGSTVLTCRIVPPTLPSGQHTIALRARANPAEAGVNPSDWSAPFGFTVMIVTPPGIPSGLRIPPLP